MAISPSPAPEARTTDPRPVLSVIMPAYNERSTIREVVRRVLASPWVGQLLIVDDGSTDGTGEVLEREIAGSDARVEVLHHPRNRGKGAAIRTAQPRLRCPFTIIQDADLEYDPAEYGRVLEPLLRGVADVVYGSRFRGEVRKVLLFWHAVGNQVITLLSNACTNLNLTDIETCYKAFRTDVFRSLALRSDRFGFEPEVTAKVARLGLRIYEVPISYHGRTYAEGKKIGWRDGLMALGVILREALWGARWDLSHGHRALRRLAPLRRYYRFLWSLLEEYAGQRVVEVGAGIGSVTQFLLERERVWVTDVDATYLRTLEARYGHRPNLQVLPLDLRRPLGPGNGGELRGVADTVVAFNVIEHLDDDLGALRTLGAILVPGGHLLLVVPAGPRLYGTLDRALGHVRRYRRQQLLKLLEQAGFRCHTCGYANAIGAVGWWLNGRVLRRHQLPRLQARVNDWLVPWLRLERRLGLPFGLSLVAMARRVAPAQGDG